MSYPTVPVPFSAVTDLAHKHAVCGCSDSLGGDGDTIRLTLLGLLQAVVGLRGFLCLFF